MHCHPHRGDWSFHLTNEKKKKGTEKRFWKLSLAIIRMSMKASIAQVLVIGEVASQNSLLFSHNVKISVDVHAMQHQRGQVLRRSRDLLF